MRGRRERGSEEEDGEEGMGEVVRRMLERNEGEEGGREALRKRMERKVRKVVRRTTTLINFPRQCLQWFLNILINRFSRTTEGIVGGNLLK